MQEKLSEEHYDAKEFTGKILAEEDKMIDAKNQGYRDWDLSLLETEFSALCFSEESRYGQKKMHIAKSKTKI